MTYENDASLRYSDLGMSFVLYLAPNLEKWLHDWFEAKLCSAELKRSSRFKYFSCFKIVTSYIYSNRQCFGESAINFQGD